MKIRAVLIGLGLILALGLATVASLAQDSTSTAQTIPDSLARPADSLLPKPDSLAQKADSAGNVADSTAGAPLRAGLKQAVDSTLVQFEDSLLEELSDSLEGGEGAAPAEERHPGAARDSLRQARRVERPGRDVLTARVIPWDWDQYTNVTEVGLKNVRDGVEYSLTHNEVYDTLFTRQQGKVVRVRGQVSRDSDGFFNMTVNAILPPDTTTAAKAAGAGNP
ncbi:hypothetical protein LLH00_10560 [bacterium]|nr:hypothetical protein [bacterium]